MMIAVIKMKLIVMSDSHGFHDKIDQVIHAHPDADAYLHCGDIDADEDLYPNLITVQGNNDLFYDYPKQRILTLMGQRILMMHGHQFPYGNRLRHMANYAREQDCRIFFYGHTHVATHDVIDGVHLINPGSLWRSRDQRAPSYAIVTLQEDIVDVTFVFRER